MNFIKRAWLVTKAKKGCTGLLVLVTSAILIFVLAGLTIKNAADSAVTSAKKKQVQQWLYLLTANPWWKLSNLTAKSSSNTTATTSVDLATAKSIAEKSGVSSYLFTTTRTANAGDGISAISTSSSSDDSSDNASQNGNQPENHGGMMTSGDFTITGVNTTDNVSDFTSGKSRFLKEMALLQKLPTTPHLSLQIWLAKTV